MEITLTDKNGRKIRFDTAAYNPAKHDAYIQQNIASIDPVMLPNGKAVKIDPAKFNSAHIQYLQSPAVQPAPEPERGTIEKVGRAAGRFGLSALEKATNIGFGIQTPMAWVMGEKAQENLRQDRKITKEMFDKNIDALGGRDLWSFIGGILVELAASGGIRAGVAGAPRVVIKGKQLWSASKGLLKLKDFTPAVKAAVAAGDKKAIWNIAGQLGVREAILEGVSWGTMRAAESGSLAKGAKEALISGAFGGVIGGPSVAGIMAKGARAGMAAEKTAEAAKSAPATEPLEKLKEQISDLTYERLKRFESAVEPTPTASGVEAPPTIEPPVVGKATKTSPSKINDEPPFKWVDPRDESFYIITDSLRNKSNVSFRKPHTTYKKGNTTLPEASPTEFPAGVIYYDSSKESFFKVMRNKTIKKITEADVPDGWSQPYNSRSAWGMFKEDGKIKHGNAPASGWYDYELVSKRGLAAEAVEAAKSLAQQRPGEAGSGTFYEMFGPNLKPKVPKYQEYGEPIFRTGGE